MISIIASYWKVYHPSEKPNSNGSIEVHAELKHVTVSSNVEAGIGRESRHIKKAFIRRFVLTHRNFATFLNLSEHCNSGCPLGVYIITFLDFHVHMEAFPYGDYIRDVLYPYSAWTSRCLFNRFGQCEGLYEWNSNDDSSTLLFYARTKANLKWLNLDTIGQ